MLIFFLLIKQSIIDINISIYNFLIYINNLKSIYKYIYLFFFSSFMTRGFYRLCMLIHSCLGKFKGGASKISISKKKKKKKLCKDHT